MQLPGTERCEVKRGATHLGSVHTDQPRPWLRVTQQQRILAIVGGVTQPPLSTRFTAMWSVTAVEIDSLEGRSAALHLPDGHVRKRRRLTEKSSRFYQPSLVSVELQCRDDLAVDPLERTRSADRAARLQPHQNDLIA